MKMYIVLQIGLCSHIPEMFDSVIINSYASKLITGRICRRLLCRYCFYSRAEFEVFRPAGATHCTDQGQIWQGGADRRSAPPCQICP